MVILNHKQLVGPYNYFMHCGCGYLENCDLSHLRYRKDYGVLAHIHIRPPTSKQPIELKLSVTGGPVLSTWTVSG